MGNKIAWNQIRTSENLKAVAKTYQNKQNFYVIKQELGYHT